MDSPSAPPLPVFFVTGGAQDGASLQIESRGVEKVIGSGADCHLKLSCSNVDYHHVQVSWEREGLLLSDLGSAGGTFLNGQRVETTRILQDGDRVCLGPPGSAESAKLLVRVPDDLPEEAPVFLAPDDSEPIVLDDGAMAAAVLVEPEPAAAPPPPEPPLHFPPPIAATPPAPMAPPPLPPPPLAVPSFGQERPAVLEQPARAAPPPLPLTPPPADRTSRPARELPPLTAPPLRRISLPDLPRSVWMAAAGGAMLVAGVLAFFAMGGDPPVLSSVSPVAATPGQTITLTGAGFDEEASGNTVRFGERPGTVSSASAGSLVVVVPADLPADAVPVTVETSGGRSEPVSVAVRRAPVATRLEPDVALPGAVVALAGHNLDMSGVTVHVDGVPAEVREAQADRLRFVVPAMPLGGTARAAKVTLHSGTGTAGPLPLVLARLPYVLEIAPVRAAVGDRVTLTGRGFDAATTVTFQGQPALVLSTSPTEVTVSVPHVGGTGTVQVDVVVQAAKAASDPVPFAVERPSTSVYRPRFFPTAAPVPGAAFVSIELGPVLALGGPDTAASVADRALAVASGLNRLFQDTGAARLRFEAGGGGTAAVSASGHGAVVRATQADAAAYARAELSGGKGSRPSPAALAAHWAALLQDIASLFLAHERPVSMVERTSRGRLFLDLYAETARRGSGGVPLSLVEPLAPSTARAFRELTLQPSIAGANPGAAVSGTWEGTLEEEGVADRLMRLRVEVSGGRLTGTLTTKAGALSVDVALRGAAYEKGVLRFAVGAGSNERLFEGKLAGAALEGVVQTADRQPVGSFRLRFVE